ncbi:hypothetical protein BGX23_011228 [Mortierella sp. AD031]|nr:hypothetical protein BGX23_011228 [Mortierella sp. AD031]
MLRMSEHLVNVKIYCVPIRGPLSFKLLTGTIASIPRLEELYCTVDTKEELRGEWFEAWSDLYFNLQSSIRKFEAYLVTNSFGKSPVAGGEDGDVYQEASEELVVSRRQGPLQHLTDLELPRPEDWTTTEEVKKALLWSPNATD